MSNSVEHAHYSDSHSIIKAAAELIAHAYQSGECREQHQAITVEGILSQKLNINVVDKVVAVSARSIYFKSLNADPVQESQHLSCSLCKNHFLETIDKNEFEISVRTMDLLRAQNIPSSCEYVCFNEQSKLIDAYFRKDAALQTQMTLPIPPLYQGLFDQVCEIQQHEFAISNAKAQKPVLATWHLSTCVAVAGFSKDHQIGFLFHIDDGSDISEAIQQLVTLLTNKDLPQISFEYILIGGVDSNHEKSEEKKKSIETQFDQKICEHIIFKRRPHKETCTFTMNEFLRDSFWSKSVRLNRSIAIDMRNEDPLSNIMGYEAIINPLSNYRKRKNTIEEAEEFCSLQTPKMNCIYSGDE